jgi:hypothetical protein
MIRYQDIQVGAKIFGKIFAISKSRSRYLNWGKFFGKNFCNLRSRSDAQTGAIFDKTKAFKDIWE